MLRLLIHKNQLVHICQRTQLPCLSYNQSAYLKTNATNNNINNKDKQNSETISQTRLDNSTANGRNPIQEPSQNNNNLNFTSPSQHPSSNNVFEQNADKWWTGEEFRLLRCMNELRVPFIEKNLNKPLADCKLLDVGCGGGILSEPLARLGASVTGIDPVAESIQVAQAHIPDDIDKNRLVYKNCLVDELSAQQDCVELFDAVIASEVLEHVHDVEGFLKHCAKLIKPDGSLFITTINQTILSYIGVILFGEHILQQLPKGTHQYNMFVNVNGLKIMLERLGFHVCSINGFMYEPVFGNFYWTPTALTHYALHAIKKVPLHDKLNYNQVRNKPKQASVVKKPNKPLDKDEMIQVIDFDSFIATCDKLVAEFEEVLTKKISTKASSATVESLKISWPELEEPVEIRDVAQISIKGNNLIALDFSSMPEAVKPAYNELLKLGNMNPQIEVHMVYCQLPKITREFKEGLIKSAENFAKETKLNLKQLFSHYSIMAKKKESAKKSGVSIDLIRGTIDNLNYHTNVRVVKVEEILKRKVNSLTNNK